MMYSHSGSIVPKFPLRSIGVELLLLLAEHSHQRQEMRWDKGLYFFFLVDRLPFTVSRWTRHSITKADSLPLSPPSSRTVKKNQVIWFPLIFIQL